MPPTRSGIRRLIRSYSVSKFPKWGAFLPLCNDMRERRVSRSYIAPNYDADSDDPAQGYRHDHAHRSDLIQRGIPNSCPARPRAVIHGIFFNPLRILVKTSWGAGAAARLTRAWFGGRCA